MPWLWRRKEKEVELPKVNLDNRIKEAQAYKLFEEGKSVALVASELILSAEEAQGFYNKWKSMRAPDEETLQAKAFKLFEEGKSPVGVAADLGISVSKANDLHRKYHEAVQEAEKTKAQFTAQAPTKASYTPFPPYRIRKTVRNPLTGYKNKLEYYPVTFEEIPDDSQWFEFSQDMGDGTYYVLDSKNKVVKTVNVVGMGFDDPCEKDPASYKAMRMRMERAKQGLDTEEEEEGEGDDEEEMEERVMEQVKREEREREYLQRLFELHVARGNTAAAERTWRMLHKDEVIEGPAAVPSLAGTPASVGSFDDFLKKHLETEDLLTRKFGGKDGVTEDKETQRLKAGADLLEGFASKILNPALEAWKSKGKGSGELDGEVLGNMRKRGKWRILKRVKKQSEGEAPKELPSKEKQAEVLPEVPQKPPRQPTTEELEQSVSNVSVPPDSEQKVDDTDLRDSKTPEFDPSSEDAKWLLDNGIPRFVRLISDYMEKVRAGDTEKAMGLAGLEQARKDFSMVTDTPLSVFFGKSRVKSIYRVMSRGWSALVADVDKFIAEQDPSVGPLAEIYEKEGASVLLSKYDPPDGVSQQEWLSVVKRYADFKPRWGFLKGDVQSRWMDDYFKSFTKCVEDDVMRRMKDRGEVTA